MKKASPAKKAVAKKPTVMKYVDGGKKPNSTSQKPLSTTVKDIISGRDIMTGRSKSDPVYNSTPSKTKSTPAKAMPAKSKAAPAKSTPAKATPAKSVPAKAMPATGGQTVSQLWQQTTGTPWSEAKKLGLTNGSYDANIKLMKDLKAGKFDKRAPLEEMTALPLKKATELEITRPDLVPSSFKKGGIKKGGIKKPVVMKYGSGGKKKTVVSKKKK
jgi:hypothetical protein